MLFFIVLNFLKARVICFYFCIFIALRSVWYRGPNRIFKISLKIMLYHSQWTIQQGNSNVVFVLF